MTRTPQLDERFADWVDGRLSAAQLEQLERDLARDALLRDAAHDYRRTVEIVRVALAVEEPAPRNFIEVVLGTVAAADDGSRQRPILAMWGSLAAAAGLVVWIAAGLLGGGHQPESADSLARAPSSGAAAPSEPADGDDVSVDLHNEADATRPSMKRLLAAEDRVEREDDKVESKGLLAAKRKVGDGKIQVARAAEKEAVTAPKSDFADNAGKVRAVTQRERRARQRGQSRGRTGKGKSAQVQRAIGALKQAGAFVGETEKTSEVERALRLALSSRPQLEKEKPVEESAVRDRRPTEQKQEVSKRSESKKGFMSRSRFAGGRGAQPPEDVGTKPPASAPRTGPLVLVLTVPGSTAPLATPSPALRAGGAGENAYNLRAGKKTPQRTTQQNKSRQETTPRPPIPRSAEKNVAPPPGRAYGEFADELVRALLPTPLELASDGSLAGLEVTPADHLASQLEPDPTQQPKGAPQQRAQAGATTRENRTAPDNTAAPGSSNAYAPAPGDRLFVVTGTARELPRYFERLRDHLAGRGPGLDVRWARGQVGRDLAGKKGGTAKLQDIERGAQPGAPSPQRDPTKARHSVWLVLRPTAPAAAADEATRRR